MIHALSESKKKKPEANDCFVVIKKQCLKL